MLTDYAQRIRKRLAVPPSRLTWLYTAILAAFVGAFVVGAKLHKVVRLSETTDGSSNLPELAVWLTVVASDLLFVVFWTMLWTWALHLAAGWRKKMAAALMHFATMIVLLFLVTEHGSFLATGALLDYDLLTYSIKHLAAIRKVIASEMGTATWLALGSMIVIAMLPIALVPFRKASAATDRQWPRAGLAMIIAVIGISVVLRAMTATLPLPGKLQMVRNNPIFEHIEDAVAAAVSDVPTEKLAQKEVQPLVVVRTPRTKKHNVVLVVLESVRAQATTMDNPKLLTTPFLNKLAQQGTRAQFAYTVVPHTTKSLVPIHCGIYPKQVPDFDEATPGALPSECLAKVLRRNGYATHFIQNPETVFERRRDLIKAFGFESMRGHEDMPQQGMQYVGYFGYEDDVMVKPAMAWVDKQKGPFYLAYLNVVSHHPYEVPRSFKKRDWGAGKKLNKYYDSIAYTDRFLSKMWKGFEERGLLDNTVFVFIGDHGEGFGEHGRWQHDQTIYEEGLRVPLLVVGPGVPKNKVQKGLWQNVDVLPTVLDALGLEVAAGDLPGKSLIAGKPHDRIYNACWRKERCQALRIGDMKYIHHYNKRDPEAFDIGKDPLEKVDLFKSKAIPAKEVNARIAEMKSWADGVNDKYKAQEQRRKHPYISTKPPAKVQFTADIKFDEMIRLVGYDIERTRLADGEATWIVYYYEVLKDPGPGWKIFVHAHGPTFRGKRKMIHGDHVPVEGSYPVSEWKKGQYITDRHWLRMKPGFPSGDYRVSFGFYNPDKKNRRAVPRGTGATITFSRSVLLTTLDVVNPKHPREPKKTAYEKLKPELKELVTKTRPVGIPSMPTVTFADVMQLLGVDNSVREVHLGDKVTWTYYYKALKKVPRYTGIFTHVFGPNGKTSHYHNAVHTPVKGGFPVHEWRQGDYIVDPHMFHIPKHFPPGEYQVWLGFWDPNMNKPRNRYIPTIDGKKTGNESRILIGTIKALKAPKDRKEPDAEGASKDTAKPAVEPAVIDKIRVEPRRGESVRGR